MPGPVTGCMVRNRTFWNISQGYSRGRVPLKSASPLTNTFDADGAASVGTFQAEAGGIVSSHLYSFSLSEPSDIFISLQMAADMSARATKLIDVGFFVAKKPLQAGGEPELVDFVAPQSVATASLRFSGDAGDYLLIPFSSGCALTKRKAHPPARVPLCAKDADGDWIPSDEASEPKR